MKKVLDSVAHSQALFRRALDGVERTGGLTQDRYERFLTMQYHLTMGVQKHFLFIANHPATQDKTELREWLTNFAREEEFHFQLAKADLATFGKEPGPCPIDVQLWWLFFDRMIQERPFVRLGATCILENVSSTSAYVLDRLIQKSGYLNSKNLKFLSIHRHGPNLDHGSQIINALDSADLSRKELSDVLDGTEHGKLFYMRLMKWIATGSESA